MKKSDYRPYKADYYSLDNKLIKEVRYQNYRQVLGKARPTKIVIQDARYGNAYSVMEYSDIRFESLPVSHFTKEYIQRGGADVTFCSAGFIGSSLPAMLMADCLPADMVLLASWPI